MEITLELGEAFTAAGLAVQQIVDPLVKALDRLSEILEKGPAAASGEPPKRGRPPGSKNDAPADPGLTLDQMKVIARKLRDEKGPPVYVKLLGQFGAKEMAGVPKDKYREFYAAAEVLLSAPAAAAAPDDDDDL